MNMDMNAHTQQQTFGLQSIFNKNMHTLHTNAFDENNSMQPQPPTPPLTPTQIPTYYPSATPSPTSSINAKHTLTNNAMNNPLHTNNMIHSTNNRMNNEKKKKVLRYLTRSQTQRMAPNSRNKDKAKVLKNGFDLFKCISTENIENIMMN